MAIEKTINLRIHHFFDIIRDYGIGIVFSPHPYGHSFHKIAGLIRVKPNLNIKIVVGCDSVCDHCLHKIHGHCDDKINHRKNNILKEEYNNCLDKRIMDKIQIKEGEVLTPIELCRKSNYYLQNIYYIYSENEKENTKERRKNVARGIKYYFNLHHFTGYKPLILN